MSGMSAKAREAIRNEAALTARMVEYYRRTLGGLIDRMNRAPAFLSGPARSDIECMRLCVEAVDMVLENQHRIAQALKEMSDDTAPQPVSDAA